jgi:CSLREA domain-containing protein
LACAAWKNKGGNMNISSNLFIRRAIRFVAGLLINAGALAASASIASAAVITVTTNLDQFGTGAPGECSLREAIQSANQDSDFDQCVGVGPYGNDVIVFSPTVTLVQLAIVGPGADNDDNSFLDLDIRDTNPISPDNLTIDGGLGGVTIQPMACCPGATASSTFPRIRWDNPAR